MNFGSADCGKLNRNFSSQCPLNLCAQSLAQSLVPSQGLKTWTGVPVRPNIRGATPVHSGLWVGARTKDWLPGLSKHQRGTSALFAGDCGGDIVRDLVSGSVILGIYLMLIGHDTNKCSSCVKVQYNSQSSQAVALLKDIGAHGRSDLEGTSRLDSCTEYLRTADSFDGCP